MGNILTRMRELAEQSANGTLGESERLALDAEYQQLKTEITLSISNANRVQTASSCSTVPRALPASPSRSGSRT
jgi:hypothetical protein